MPVEVVKKNIFKTIGEAPHWDEATQSILYVDIFENCVYRYNSVTKENQRFDLDDTVGFVIPWIKGGVIVGCGKRFLHFDLNTDEKTIIAELDTEEKVQINDAKCDARGRIWAGTFGKCKDLSLVPKEAGALYCLELDGTLTERVDKITISNGLAWSENNETMYFVDSVPGIVYSFDYDIDKGIISNRKTIMEFEKGPFGSQFPDGMTIDTDGMLWIACFYGGRVIRVDPNTGRQLRSVEMPALQITSCSFGGKDWDELYVTCCKDDKDETYPLNGSLFKVTRLGVKGHRANIYQGYIPIEKEKHCL